jgi:DNA-binding transcriptional regulator YiaG
MVMQALDPTELTVARQASRNGDLRAMRQQLDLSVREAAAAVGVNVATWSRWERALTRPTGAAAQRLGA